MSQPADSSASEAVEATTVSPSEAFALLGNETRIEILQALHDAGADEDPVPFSTLHERTSIDDSAHFNYHLKQLTDHFIRKCESGYTFRHAGWKAVRSVFAGTFTDHASLEPFAAPGECYHCGTGLQARYGDEHLTVECPECDRTHVTFPFAPGALADRTPQELLQAFHHHVRHHYCLAADGVCPECLGRVETTLTRDATLPGLDVQVDHVCRRCGNALHSAVGLNLLDNADVLTFHAERGVDLSTAPFWTFEWCVSDQHTEIVSEDPLQVRVDVPCAGDTMCVVVDETMDILDVDGCAQPVSADD
jgi:hypothetical protein